MSLMSGKMTGPERQSSISTANSPNSPSVYKIITLGNVGSGKSTLIETFIREECPDHEPAIRQTFKEQKMLLQGQRLRQVEIWDTAGQERFDSLPQNYYRHANGCMICFDITDEKSYKDVMIWYKKLRDNHSPVPPTLLIGTKSDLRTEDSNNDEIIPLANCRVTAQNLGLKYIEVSSYKMINIQEAFLKLITMIDEEQRGDLCPDCVTLDTPENQLTIKQSGCVCRC